MADGERARWVKVAKGAIVVGLVAYVGCQELSGRSARAKVRPLRAQSMLISHRFLLHGYWDQKGELPQYLEDALSAEKGGDSSLYMFSRPRGQQAVDPWHNSLAYERRPDGEFEVRSGGPDGEMRTADDLVEGGSITEDLAPKADRQKWLRDQILRLTPRRPLWRSRRSW